MSSNEDKSPLLIPRTNSRRAHSKTLMESMSNSEEARENLIRALAKKTKQIGKQTYAHQACECLQQFLNEGHWSGSNKNRMNVIKILIKCGYTPKRNNDVYSFSADSVITW